MWVVYIRFLAYTTLSHIALKQNAYICPLADNVCLLAELDFLGSDQNNLNQLPVTNMFHPLCAGSRKPVIGVPGVSAQGRMNVKLSVAGENTHPELSFPGRVKVGKTTLVRFDDMNVVLGSCDILLICVFSGAAKPMCASLNTTTLFPYPDKQCWEPDHFICFVSLKVLTGSSWPLNTQRRPPSETAEFWTPGDNGGLHRKKCACVWVFACSLFSTLINNVTAHVATWPVSSQQPASSCQELFNPHTNKTLPGRDFTAPLIKLLFWDGNLAQSLLICLAFSVPIRDSSPWQTNKPLLGVWWCQTAWRKQFLAKAEPSTRLNPFPWNKCTAKTSEKCAASYSWKPPWSQFQF